jgi:hypothetical protein
MQMKDVSSFFGWTFISRKDVRNAEAQMRSDNQGVRDELGFLALHKGYADRFFPGTSVLQTRLRYVFFVPWMYARIADKAPKGHITQIVKFAERDLVLRINPSQDGIIGIDSTNYITSQPPSQIYWSALGAWNIVRKKNEYRRYSRADLHALLTGRSRKTTRDDDGRTLNDEHQVFYPLPDPPSEWFGQDKLSFVLRDNERNYIKECWRNLPVPQDTTQKSLLAKLSIKPIANVKIIDNCWDERLLKIAAAEKEVMLRAQAAASLALLGRAAYAALVEGTRETRDKVETAKRHRNHLKVMLEQHRALALRLKVDEVEDDIGLLDKHFGPVVQQTLDWLMSGKNDPEPLRQMYRSAEHARKLGRARLPEDGTGREKRLEWNSDQYPLASALHYRWPRVRRMLADLHGQP